MITSDFNSVMEKTRVHLKEKHNKKILDQDIAVALEITKEHYCRCKKANKIPLEAIMKFCVKENIVINYILYDQLPDSLNPNTEKLIGIKYFKSINSSAGGGSFNEDEEFEYLYLDTQLLKLLGGQKNIKNIEAINVVGDSMEPLLKDKSVILINRSQTSVSLKEEIFVINTPNGIYVKLICKNEDNQVVLKSLNDVYKKEVYSLKDVIVIGKVVGSIDTEYLAS